MGSPEQQAGSDAVKAIEPEVKPLMDRAFDGDVGGPHGEVSETMARIKTPHVVLSFASTADAMAIDALARDLKAEGKSFPGRMIPLPPAIDAGCGFAWSAPLSDEETLLAAMDEHSLTYQAKSVVDLF